MLNTASTNTPTENDSYFDRNARWIFPAVITMMLATTPTLRTMLGLALPLPTWLATGGVVIGAFLTGYQTLLVDTVSARVVGIVAAGLAVGIIVVAIFR